MIFRLKKMKYTIVFFLLFIGKTVCGQDFQLSGYNQLPVNINPAMTGFIEKGKSRAMATHRNQWSSILNTDAFKTYAASYEHRICDNNFWGLGGFVMTDKSGSPSFNTTQALFSLSYHHKLSSGTHLAVGINTGLLNYRIDDNLAFSEQFDGNVGFDTALPNFENTDNFNSDLLDLGAGLLWYKANTQTRGSSFQWHLGLAFQHLIPSSQYTFTQSSNQNSINLRVKKTVHGGLNWKFNKNRKLAFKGIFQWQVPHWQLTSGFYLQLSSIKIGAAARITQNQPKEIAPPLLDAIILSLSYQVNNTSFGMSYDLNVSPLRTATNYKGGFEVTITQFFGNLGKCVYCPN